MHTSKSKISQSQSSFIWKPTKLYKIINSILVKQQYQIIKQSLLTNERELAQEQLNTKL